MGGRSGRDVQDRPGSFLHGERVDAPDKLKGALQTGLKKVQDGTTAILNVMLSR